ncbi:MAG: T9SS type A sorting domain-containing protein [Elusimicrobia bacterium]|nr:T9SS type A sorting domain-containing protein [Elusimicrobiota bacterium]
MNELFKLKKIKHFFSRDCFYVLFILLLFLSLSSVHSLFAGTETDVSSAFAYPVPFKTGSGHKNITFTNLPDQGSIRIYSSQGEQVRKINFSITSGSSALVWDVKNDHGEELASDVYLYVIESLTAKKTGKLIVTR